MRRTRSLVGIAALVGSLLTAGAANGNVPAAPYAGPHGVRVSFHPVTGGLNLPVQVTSASEGLHRLYVVEQGGLVRLYAKGNLRSTPYLNLQSEVSTGGERGMLSIAFHPHFAKHPFVFASYTRSDGALQVSRFRAASPHATSVAMSTERHIIAVPHAEESNHNAGQLLFGAHGLLFISTGDGGGGGDPFARAENLTSLSGKLLRLDIDHHCGGHHYCIPSGNPFPHASNTRKRAVFDWGLRNPWRLSIDRADGRIWLADVGQDTWEEINWVPQRGGKDFGWSCREAMHSYNSSRCNIDGQARHMTSPVHEYSHAANRCAVIGGFAYRGSTYRYARGIYVYSDYCGGQVYGLKHNADGSFGSAQIGSVSSVTGYGENDRGEIYAVSGGGTLFHVVFHRR